MTVDMRSLQAANCPDLPLRPIAIEFVPRRSKPAGGEATHRVMLDVGGLLGPGVLDHHRLEAFRGSTTELVAMHPEMVLAGVDPGRSAEPVTLVLPESPDLDTACASFLACSLLRHGSLPPLANRLARYASRNTQGYLCLARKSPHSLYSAYILVSHRLHARNWRNLNNCWSHRLEAGWRLVEFVLEEAERSGLDIPDVDAFRIEELLGPLDRQVIYDDLDRYGSKLRDPATDARIHQIVLPETTGGVSSADILFVRDVQLPSDPSRCLFFKEWARTDTTNSPRHDGFAALCIFQGESHRGPRRCVVSVSPESGLYLPGLADRLQKAEERKEPRSRVTADTWYDGRAHAYTIVSSPWGGTKLSYDEIVDVIKAQGSGPGDGVPRSRPQELPNDQCSPSLLSRRVELHRAKASHPRGTRCRVMVSYPRAVAAWVARYVADPLTHHYGPDAVFVDQGGVSPGDTWLTEIAHTIDECELFVVVWCPAYFDSGACRWELQLAIQRDIDCSRGLILPIVQEAVQVPSWCRLPQFHDATAGLDDATLLRMVEARLGPPMREERGHG